MSFLSLSPARESGGRLREGEKGRGDEEGGKGVAGARLGWRVGGQGQKLLKGGAGKRG